MKAVVVYESLWGNTAAIARAIGEGLGPEVQVLSTAEATAGALAEVDLIVVGAPILAFRMPTDGMLQAIGQGKEKAAPDLSQPAMATWLAGLPAGSGRAAAFETGFRWAPGSAAGAIGRGLERAGYRSLAKGQRFIVTGKYGPLRTGEVARARQWGVELAQAMK